MKTLFSLIQSPLPPDFPGLYQELGIVAERFDSARNLHRALQKKAPDFFVGEFVYGWGRTMGSGLAMTYFESMNPRLNIEMQDLTPKFFVDSAEQ